MKGYQTMLDIVTLVLGPVRTNCYLMADTETCQAAVIDPAWDAKRILDAAQQRNWKIEQLWITHAHFDHIGAVKDLLRTLQPPPAAWLHPKELPLWMNKGGAYTFGLRLETGPWTGDELKDGQTMKLGRYTFKVIYTPGHTPGHCLFHYREEALLFSGDLLFKAAVGRTDLPGGDWEALVNSIQNRVYTLPDLTRVFSGHGEATTVGEEKRTNPFIQEK
jgi:hydroxyacylglutathione hydrolase